MSEPKKYIQDELIIEICPNCEETLSLYASYDVFNNSKIFRCKYCHTELVMSERGWVKA